MSNASMICSRVLSTARFNMDSTDGPQRKIFRARKTMKVSDRQQLETVYKVKENSRNTREVKRLNGKHKKGDSDASSSDSDCMEVKPGLNGMQGISLGPDIETVGAMEGSEVMENKRDHRNTGLHLKLELLPIEKIMCDQAGTSKTPSTQLDQSKDIHFNAVNDRQAQGLDQRENKGASLCGSERSCEKDITEEQMEESGPVKTVFLNDQSVEEMVLTKQPEVVLVSEKLIEAEQVEAEPEQDLLKDDLESLEVEPFQEPLKDGEEAAHDLLLVEEVLEPQQKELLKEQPQEELTEESQQNVVIPTEPQGDLAPTGELEVAVSEETQLEETLIEKTQLEGMMKEEPKQQELLDRPAPEMGRAEWPQLKVGLAQEPQIEAGLVEGPTSVEELTEDQQLEELAEEHQFGEELAEDHLLDEVIEDQRPENVLQQCVKTNSPVEDEPEVRKEETVEVAEQERNEEKLEMQEKTEEKSVVEEKDPEVMIENQDLELETEGVVEKQEMKEHVQFELLEEEENANKVFIQKSEEKQDPIEDKAEEMECNWDMKEKVEEMEDKFNILEENNLVDVAGEHAISSSMEIDQDYKVDQTKELPEASVPKPLVDLQNTGCDLEYSDSMETDDIIPILEKLSPVKEGLHSFSKPPVLYEVDTRPELEDNVELNQGSPSKEEYSENLPLGAFLVLSDEEEDPYFEVGADDDVQLKQSNPTVKVPAEVAEKELDAQKDEPHKEETPPESSAAPHRKRSKSDDAVGVQSKRRRSERKEYEAELQVKITTRANLDRKLQKVIQRLLEDKLCALQCADFDKALSELKTRVEKIECKKHESVLSGMQAKIARLLKRCGAAKEDMKKRQETQAVQPVHPVQPGSQSKAAGDGTKSSLAQGNLSTEPQMAENKPNVGDTPATPFQSPTSAAPLPLTAHQRPQPTSSNQPIPHVAQTPTSQSPVTGSTPTRPVTSTQVVTPVLFSPTNTAIVGTSQVSSSNGQPVSVSLQSLQSLPMILHLPVMQNGSVMQTTTGTLVTNRLSGKMEFFPSQNQGNFGNLQQQPKRLVTAIAPKPNNSLSLPSPAMQQNSPASATFSGPTLSVQSVSTAQSVTQVARTSMPAVSTPGQYTPTTISTPEQHTATPVSTPGQYTPTTNSHTPMQMKSPVPSCKSLMSAGPPAAPRAESQINQNPPIGATVVKKAAESTTQSGKAGGGGFIDLTLDDDDGSSSQDDRRPNQINMSGNSQTPQLQPRPPQAPQTAAVQLNTSPAGLPSQTTLQRLPTAQTTVNVNHGPVTQTTPRFSTPRTPTSQQVVSTTIPSAPVQIPVRNAAMQGQNQGSRQVSPQTGGVTSPMPQSTPSVVNNGKTIGSRGPQQTVLHWPPQESLRFIHPATLPEAPQPQHLPPEAARTSPPQKPHLKLARVQSQNGIVLSWSVLEVDHSCAKADSYHLYAYHEEPKATTPSQWKKVGEVKALALPMACTLTQFMSGSKYYFAVRARDVYGRFGAFCDPQSTDVITTQSS